MSDLIDRSALPTMRIEIPANLCDATCGSIIEIVSKGFQAMIDSVPAVDAVEVVRCENCEHWYQHRRTPLGSCYCECLGVYRPAHFYCAYGKKGES